MFRQLCKQEENQFKQWAQENYIPHTEINPVWHPVVQSECRNETLVDKSLEIK